jgi:hypothetical protein
MRHLLFFDTQLPKTMVTLRGCVNFHFPFWCDMCHLPLIRLSCSLWIIILVLPPMIYFHASIKWIGSIWMEA